MVKNKPFALILRMKGRLADSLQVFLASLRSVFSRHSFRPSLLKTLSAIPGRPPAKRSLDEWKRLRKVTTSEVKKNLEEGQPVLAIRKLCRVLVEDGQYPPYLDLLQQAVVMKRRRKGASSKQDPYSDFSEENRKAAIQLDAFVAYVQELDALLSKARFSSFAPPVARRERQAL